MGRNKSFLYLKVFFTSPISQELAKAYCWLSQTVCLSQRLFFLYSFTKRTEKINFLSFFFRLWKALNVLKILRHWKGNSGKKKIAKRLFQYEIPMPFLDLFYFQIQFRWKTGTLQQILSDEKAAVNEWIFFPFNFVRGEKELDETFWLMSVNISSFVMWLLRQFNNLTLRVSPLFFEKAPFHSMSLLFASFPKRICFYNFLVLCFDDVVIFW